MLTRILTAVVGIPLVIVTLFVWDGSLFAVGIGVMSVLAANEYFRAVRQAGRANPHELLGLAACAALVGGAWCGWQLPAILTAVILLAMILETFRQPRAPISNIGSLFIGILYAGWLFSFLVLLRSNFSGLIQVRGIPQAYEHGAYLVLYVLMMVWATDTLAYFCGKFLGKRKLCPSLSPGKTVVGAVGGLLGAILVGGIVGIWFRIPAPHALAMGVLAGVFGQIGDLIESGLKRDLGIKDFGALLPGHGGVLDRFDSALIVTPIIFGYIVIVLRW